MSVSFRKICISDGKVHEVTNKEVNNGEMIKPGLAGKEVLGVTFIYELINRKPVDLIRAEFSRMAFDDKGVYRYDQDKEANIRARNILSFAFHSGDDENTIPLPIPVAPIEPTKEEIVLINEYLERKYQELLRKNPNAIDEEILNHRELHQKRIKMMKDSYNNK